MSHQGVFEDALNLIKEAKKVREEGGVNSIPFGLPSLDKHIPGIIKGMQYKISANSGVGKTQLAKFLFVNQAYKFIKENPHLGIKLKIMYFALEESKEEFMFSLISNRLKEHYGLTVDSMTLRGFTNILPDDIVVKVESCREYFSELEKSIDIIDSESSPIGIYQYVRGYATDNGKHHWKNHTYTRSNPDGTISEEIRPLYDYYEPNDTKEFVIVLIDHLGLLQGDGTLHDSMGQMSTTYGRKMITKHFKYVYVDVHQQMSETEKQQFTNSGQSIESKLEPSLNGLGNNKEVQRDSYFVIGLFAPERYQIEKHLGYDITVLKDFYRCLSIMKNRMGTPNIKIPLLFNGASNTFSQLPKADAPEMNAIYEAIRNYRRLS